MKKPRLSAKVLPGKDFKTRTLNLVPYDGARLFRAFQTRHPDPLGYRPARNRFSDPRIQPDPKDNPSDVFATVFFGENVETCVLETIIRDTGVGTSGTAVPISKAYMQSWSVTDVVCTAPLRLLDLRADGCLQNKIPTDAVRAQNHLLGQLWAYAIHEHPDQPDGIMFSSRLNEATNVAVFDRAMPKMNAVSHQPLFDYRSELAHILTKYQVGLV
jgi:hypothetical protein